MVMRHRHWPGYERQSQRALGRAERTIHPDRTAAQPAGGRGCRRRYPRRLRRSPMRAIITGSITNDPASAGGKNRVRRATQ